MRRPSSLLRPLLSGLLCLLLSAPLLAAQPFSQYDVEAAYLYNFGKFVRWPAAASKQTTFDICILGKDPFGGTLERLIANDTMDGRVIRKRIITQATDANGCAIVYISDSEAPRVHSILSDFSNKPALLVSGLPTFADDGGMVQFLVENQRVRFEINLDAASRCGLEISSELLKVASGVMGKPQRGGAR